MLPPGSCQVFTALLYFPFLHSLALPVPLKSSPTPLFDYTHLCMEFLNYCQLLCEDLSYTLFSAGKWHPAWAGKHHSDWIKYFPQGKTWVACTLGSSERGSSLPFQPMFSSSGHLSERSDPLSNISHNSCPGINASSRRLWGLVTGVEPIIECCVILSSWTAFFLWYHNGRHSFLVCFGKVFPSLLISWVIQSPCCAEKGEMTYFPVENYRNIRPLSFGSFRRM